MRTLKIQLTFNIQLRTEIFYGSGKLNHAFFLFWLIEIVIFIFNVSDHFK